MKYSVTEYKLKNGGKGLIVNVPDSPVMFSEINFRAGARYVKDYANKSETAHIMEHMAFGASESFSSAHDYDLEFTKNGAYHNAFTSDLHLNYLATSADFEWDRILKLQHLSVATPKFIEEEFKSESGNVRSELTGYLSQSGRILWPRLAQAMGDPTKTIQEGLDSMKNITLDDIKEHYKRTHTAKNMRFVVAGDFGGDRLKKLHNILDDFQLQPGVRLSLPKDKLKSAPTFVVRRKDVPSISLALSLSIPRKLNDIEIQAMNILNHILNGSLHSRVQGEARRRGLLYYMWSQSSATNCGYSDWDFGSEISESNLVAVINLLVREIDRIKNGLIDEYDIESAKSYSLGRHQIGIQTTSQLAGFLGSRYFYNNVIDDFAELPNRIKSIKAQQIIDLVREFIASDCWSIGLYGNTRKSVADDLYARLAKLF